MRISLIIKYIALVIGWGYLIFGKVVLDAPFLYAYMALSIAIVSQDLSD